MNRIPNLLSVFIALSTLLFAGGSKAVELKSPDWKSVHFDLGTRWVNLVFEPQRNRTRMVFCISLLRDETGRPVEGNYVQYNEVDVKLFDDRDKEVKCQRTWPEQASFIPIEAGIGSHNGEYSLPAGVRSHLRRAVITFHGQTVKVSLRHLKPI
ncbi:MAG: hypothetical protein WDN28_23840 [Chthoniobacter sp.]